MDEKAKKIQTKLQDMARSSEAAEIMLGIVVETDPVRGTCKVAFESTKESAIDIPYMTPFAGVCGTVWDRPVETERAKKYESFSLLDSRETDNKDYYNSRKKAVGKAQPEYVTEGMLYTIPVGSAVIVLSRGDGASFIEGSPSKCIIGCLNLPGLENSRGYPAVNAVSDENNIARKWGDSNPNRNRSRDRIVTKANDYADEVGLTADKRKFLADKDNNIIPLMPNDIFWQVMRKAKVIPSHRDLRWVEDRIQRDAKRLMGLYYLGGNGGSDTAPSDDINYEVIKREISECMIRISKEGKILIGSNFDQTVVECFSSEDGDYDRGKVVPGCYFVTGLCGGINYTEVSSSDWYLNVFARGYTKFSNHWRIHGHKLDAAQHNLHGEQQEKETVIHESDLSNANGIEYHDVNYLVVDGFRTQFNVDGVQFDCPPSAIFFKNGKSLQDYLDGN